MNNLFSKYSKKFMGLAMASLVFTACEKEQFTEQDALDLELKRLQEQERIAEEMDKMNHKQSQDMAAYQRTLDSLDRLNAGGLVYYSVIPVAAAEAVFASGGSNGRAEEIQGVDGATVTISQYGRVIVAGDDNGNGQNYGESDFGGAASAANGVYTFPMLRSGEVGVTVQAPGHSTANYIANLTPDGSVANGQITYVSNVIPLFNIADADKMATITGKAWVETDLTNGVEEQAPDGTSLTGTIDVASDKSFWDKYFKEANDESKGYSDNTNTYVSKSGYVQRFAYELPANSGAGIMRTTVSGGNYSLLVPSTSVGLPIQLQFSEFAADRTFYRDNKVVQSRFVYGPKVTADAVETGVTPISLAFSVVQTPAQLAVTYTPEVKSPKWDVKIDGSKLGWWFDTNLSYLPTVTINNAADGTLALQAGAKADDAGAVFDWFLGLTTANAAYARVIDGATAPTVTVERKDVFSIGKAFAQGSATGEVNDYVKILNSGTGFTTAGTNRLTVTTPNVYTGYPPQVVFPAPSSGNPGDFARGTVVLDEQTGIVNHIVVTNKGRTYFTAGDLNVDLSMGRSVDVATRQVNADFVEPLIVLANPGQAGGTVVFNPQYFGTTVDFTTATFNGAATFVSAALGGEYSYLPSVGVNTATTNANILTSLQGVAFDFRSQVNTVPTFTTGGPAGINPDFGRVVRLDLTANLTTFTPAADGTGTMGFSTINGVERRVYAFSTAVNAISGQNVSAQDMGIFIDINAAADPSGFDAVGGVSAEGVGVGQYTYNNTPVSGLGHDVGSNLNFASAAFDGFGITKEPLYFAGATWGYYTSNPLNEPVANFQETALTESDYLVYAETTFSGSAAGSWGVPNFSAGGVFEGIRWAYQGTAYAGSVTAGYDIIIVPNPFKDAEARAAVTGSYEKVATELQKIYANRTQTFTNGANGITVVQQVTPAKLTLTVTNGGLGYLAVPKIMFFGEGVKMDDELIADANALAGKLIVDKDGKLALSGTAELVGAAITHKTYATEAANLKVNVVDIVAEELNDQWTKMISASTPVGGMSSVFGVNSEGNVYLDVNKTVAGKKAWEWISLEANTFTAAAIGTEDGVYYDSTLPLSITISAPAAANGVQATATAAIELVNTTANARRLRVTLTEAGSGYARGNHYFNDGKGAATDGSTPDNGDSRPTSNGSMAGQSFRLIGGNEADAEDMRFEVYTGITYVRDVHYGTGKEVE